MNTKKKRLTVAALLVSAVVASSSAVACKSGTVTFKAHTPVAEAEGDFTIGGQPLGFAISGDSSTTGLCVGITFKNSSGMAVGQSSGKIPTSGQVPEGAVQACYEVTEPSSSRFAGGAQGSYVVNATGKKIPYGLQSWSFLDLPLEVDLVAGMHATSLDVFAEDIQSARSVAQAISQSGLAVPLTPEVEVRQYLEAKLDQTGTTVIVTIAEDDPFATMSLFVASGSSSYSATLQDALVSQGQGWRIATYSVPFAALDIDYTLGVTNEIYVGVSYEESVTGRLTEYDATMEFVFTAFP